MVVYTQGSYDIFHAGHVNFLRRSAKFGEVTVGLLTDEAFEKYRGYPPVNKYENRKAVLEACEFVERVMPTDNENTERDIINVKPDVITIGTDWIDKNIYNQWRIPHGSIDNQLIYIPYTKGISSTKIRKKVKGE